MTYLYWCTAVWNAMKFTSFEESAECSRMWQQACKLSTECVPYG